MEKLYLFICFYLLLLNTNIATCTRETWYDEVSGYNIKDGKNGYAGSRGNSLTGFYLCGSRKYRVHYIGDDKNSWTGEYSECGVIGIGRKIDAISISGGSRYRVRYRFYKGGAWESEVNGYNIYDSRNGYAGTMGQEIDAVMVEGGNSYRVAYGDESSNVEKVAQRVVKKLFGVSHNFNFDYEVLVLKTPVADVTGILNYHFQRSSNKIFNLIVKNGKADDIQIGNIKLFESIDKLLNQNLDKFRATLKVVIEDGIYNGEVEVSIDFKKLKIEYSIGSKITANHWSFRGGVKIIFYLKNNNPPQITAPVMVAATQISLAFKQVESFLQPLITIIDRNLYSAIESISKVLMIINLSLFFEQLIFFIISAFLAV